MRDRDTYDEAGHDTPSEAAMFSHHREGEAADRIRALATELGRKGFKHFRVTRHDVGIYMEAWTKQPWKERMFNPSHVKRVLIAREKR